MLGFLKHALSGQNQFASGGLLLMIIGKLEITICDLKMARHRSRESGT